MKKVYHVCTKEVTYNGKKYYLGYPWLPEDGGSPPPAGTYWVIRQEDDAESPQMGYVQWVPQPGRVQPSFLTPQEKEQLSIDPYASLKEAPAPPPPAPAAAPQVNKKKPAPIMPDHLQMTQAERDDPYGLKARAAELKEDSPVDPPEE